MTYPDTRPFPGDSNEVLLKKLLQRFGDTVPNGPLTENEILALIVTRVSVALPNPPNDKNALLVALLSAFPCP